MLTSGNFWFGVIVGVALYFGFLWWKNRQASNG